MYETNEKKAAALKYDIKLNQAPIVIAKGKGEVANNIIRIAKENKLPIKKDADLVELLTNIELDKEVPDNMYKAVAEIFSYIYELSRKKEEEIKKLKKFT